ncbi:MAG: sugar phosphate isomerase/epimerase, partial [Chloroflexi bacterium]|nr:sugar phosphate isomerase/epimerase [Chloroflexota bacterium]
RISTWPRRGGTSELWSFHRRCRCSDARLAERFRTRLALESGSGITQYVDRMVQLLREINSPFLGACLRFDGEENAALAPFAIHAHAASRAFDALGRETTADYPACMAALRDADYHGWISIQYEGNAEPVFGIVQTAELISALASP